MRANAVIVAAGEGTRIGGNIPKPYLLLEGRPVILHTLSAFLYARTVNKVVLVVAAKEMPRCSEVLKADSTFTRLNLILKSGGASRQDSVSRGLERLDEDCEVVVIHDGVRPLVSPSLIDRCAEAAYAKGAVVLGVPVRDTIKVVSSDRWVRETLVRDSLWEIQTPQAFRTEIIRKAHDEAARTGNKATDDAMLVERLGMGVYLLEGERTNIKITVPEDLKLASSFLRKG